MVITEKLFVNYQAGKKKKKKLGCENFLSCLTITDYICFLVLPSFWSKLRKFVEPVSQIIHRHVPQKV